MDLVGQSVLSILTIGKDGNSTGDPTTGHQLNVWKDTRTIFFYLSCASLILLPLHAVWPHTPLGNWHHRYYHIEDFSDVKESSEEFDVAVIRALESYAQKIRAMRLLGCFTLLALAGYLVFHEYTPANALLFISYIYVTALSLFTMLTTKMWRLVSSRQLSLILFTAFCIYTYRDLVPLALRKPSPDHNEGWIPALRLSLLFFCGFVVPVILPRCYMPVDPEHPKTPIPQQTSSWLSMVTFSHIDPVIYHAYKHTELKMDDLPLLADNDKSRHLVKTSFPLVDPVLLGRKRHIFWGLLVYYKWEYVAMFGLLILQVINDFAAPIATLKLLTYIESENKEGLVQPWVWILWLGVGPMFASISVQTFLYLTTVVYVQIEAIFTHLIFEHSLRIRINSHTTDAPSKDSSKEASKIASPSNGSATPSVNGDASLPDGSSANGGDDAATVNRSTSHISGTTAVSESGSTAASDGKPAPAPTTTAKKVEDQTGKLLTMLSTDLKNIQWGQDWMMPIFFLVRIVICTVFLYKILGWSALVGIGFIILTLPIPALLAKLLMTIQEVKMKKTDARIQIINQVMNVLRMVKLFAWEEKIEGQIAEKRNNELKYILKSELIDIGSGCLNSILPLATMLAVYATYTLAMKKELSASVVFPSAAVFSLFRNIIFQAFYEVPSILRAKVSLDRLGEYLNGGELLETPVHAEYTAASMAASPPDAPYFRDAVFTWNKQGTGANTPGRRKYRLQIEGEVLFKKGKVNLICGPTGSGKTSMLMALLGEMYFNPNHPTSTVYLPRDGGVSYAAQESWVINETIKQNILFQTPYDEERYKKVIHQCGLERDLSILDAGDMTEVGEKGITLSGGQKARITLARAVYSKAEVVLLDDVLSALDVHTSKWVAEKCLGGDLLEGRTVLLVTHNVLLAETVSDYVVSIGLDGKIASQGSVKDALEKNSHLRKQVSKAMEAEDAAEPEQKAAKDEEPAVDKPDEKSKGKLIVAEEMAIGHVSWKAAKLYLGSMGGALFFMFLIPIFTISTFFPVLQNWFLGFWSSQYEVHDTKDIPVKTYLAIYGLILLVDVTLQSTGQVIFILGAVRASRAVHARLIRSILSSTFRWLDTVPISRVITRCAQDCQTIDGMFPQLALWTCYVSLNLLVSFCTIIISSGLPTLPPALLVVAMVLVCGRLYINAQLPVKRNMSNNKSPILGHIGNVLNGIISVRAYAAQAAFRDESERRVDVYTRSARTYWNMNRWIGLRMDSIGGFFGGFVAAWLIYGRTLPAGTVGFTLTVLGSFTGFLLQWIRMLNETEVQANSLERILEYIEIDHEPTPTEDGKPPAYWPASGEVVVEHLTARYSADGPEVLKDLTFHIQSGERVGVVGRTGAGKSTVALALLRTIPTEGTVMFDGRATSEMNLEALRSNATIIPQHPELLAGTLRENLDPFSEHDDAVLNAALRASGLFRLQTEGEDGGITLDTDVQAGGSNFSQGQRQIIALARAIVRRSKLLILDEATAAIDYETDQAIQTSIRTEFKDATVITVAHRLKTIMDSDKIMVLDDGKMVEYDSPQSLLKKKAGLFYHLVEESSDRDELYKLTGL